MSENYRNYELNQNGAQPWYATENALFKEIINKLPPADSSMVGTEHYHTRVANAAGTTVISVDATSGISAPYLNEGTLVVDANHKVTSSTLVNGSILDTTAFPDPIPVKPMFLWSETNDALYVGITGAQNYVQVGSSALMGITGAQGIQGMTGVQGYTGVGLPLPITDTTQTATTVTPNSATTDVYVVKRLTTDAVFAAPTGSPVNGQTLVIRVKDDGTAHNLSYNAIYVPIEVTLPTTTVANKYVYIGCLYNSDATKWDVLTIGQQV